jgi:hypothetical protein
VIRKALLEGCRGHANIFFGTLLINLDFRFVYDAFYQAIILAWTIVGASAVTVIIAVRCWCCGCLTFGQDTDVMFGYNAFTIVHTAVANLHRVPVKYFV